MPLEEQVYLFFKFKGDEKATGGIPLRLIEYNRLTFFWEKFGLNKDDLKKEHPEWIKEMYEVGLAVSKVRSEEISNTKKGSAFSEGTRRAFAGKHVQTEKIL